MSDNIQDKQAEAARFVPVLGARHSLDGEEVALIANGSIRVSPDMLEYLQDEACKRHISIEEAYREEMAGQARASQGALTSEELRKLAETTQPDERLLEGDEECPF